MNGKIKKISLGVLVAIFAFVNVAGFLATAKPAKAQFVVQVAADIQRMAKTIKDNIVQFFKTGLLQAVGRIVAYALHKLAYDGAVWLASGGKGQGAQAFKGGFKDYMKNVADDAAGMAIEALGKGVGGDGFNICQVPDIKLNLSLKIGLRFEFGAPSKPACSLTKFLDTMGSGDAWKSKYGSQQALGERFNASLKMEESDLGIQLKTKEAINNRVATQVNGKQLERQEGGGFIGKTVGRISSAITTPAGVIGEKFKKAIPDSLQNKSEAQLAQMIAAGDVKVIPGVLGVFLSTLAGTMVKNFQENGMLPFGLCIGSYGGPDCKSSGSTSVALNFESAGFTGGVQAAEQAFAYLKEVDIGSVDKYDILGDLNSCPDGNYKLYNCRADNDLIQGIQQFETGNPVTIAEAIKSNYLHGERLLIPPSRQDKNTDKNCYKDAYCYDNIKVLRQARILPLGFEIAALNSDPDHPWTLQQVVNGFNKCGNSYDPVNYPFCHLIDPNWVLKVPPTRCNALVDGSVQLSAEVPDRIEDCADLSSCVAYNQDGTCKNYAYCTREKNSWKPAADSCSPQFATCNVYQTPGGNEAGYLARTLDTQYCDAGNVGCSFYSLTENGRGGWAEPGFDAKNNQNNGIYFNSQAAQNSCGANTAGCSAFVAASSTNQTLFLKKAPAYLNCYDIDEATDGIQWPVTSADLSRIQARPECAAYADICIPDEVGCSLFTPVTGGDRPVPGKYNPNDVLAGGDTCANACVGYDAYREMPSTYSGGQDVAYIIPQSGQTCSSDAEGCSGFTNLSTTAGGVESVDYFAYLRPCLTPYQNPGKNFITYEGTIVGGFQLVTYKLVANTAAENSALGNPNNEIGAPRYFYKTSADLADYVLSCNETNYKARLSSPDCRQFTDSAGKIYYRLLSKTIPITDSCTPYRLNTTELYNLNDGTVNAATCVSDKKGLWNDGGTSSDSTDDSCQVCYQNGEYKDGYCFYYGLAGGVANSAGESRTCSASVETCRAYKGNAGNNIRNVFIYGTDGAGTVTFENSSTTIALSGWGPAGVMQAPESTHVREHSVGYTGNGSLTRDLAGAEALSTGKSYDLTFWAKGSGQTVSVMFKDLPGIGNGYSKLFGSASVGNTWNLYHFGPIEFNNLNSADPAKTISTTSIQLAFQNPASGGSLYVDNIRLVEVTDYKYLVKKSLSVDAACDSHLDDNLPGEALGCKAYTDPNGAKINLVNFSFICREGAIGCINLFDTQNTFSLDASGAVAPGDEGPRAYNVWIAGQSGELLKKAVGGKEVSCQVPVGGNGCYVNALGDAGANILATIGADPFAISTSTIYIHEDTSSSAPIYLVANKSATCIQADVGCTIAGAQTLGTLGATYITTTIKNDPKLYLPQGGQPGILCQSEAVGCNAYTSAAGNTYFKDPAAIGQKICAYQDKVTSPGGAEFSGWFWKGVGVCQNNIDKNCTQNSDCGAKTCSISRAACNSNLDCSAGQTCDEPKCEGVDEQPCYPDYLQNGTSYGLWSLGDKGKYQNYVGECPVDQDQCTEFVDNNDKDANGAGNSYFLIKDNKVSEGTCSGQVSLKSGCVLFSETANPNKYWSTKASYALSDSKDAQLVRPVDGGAQNDANLIMKVTPDRECGEWLQCRSSHTEWDSVAKKFKTVCDAIGRCDKYNPSAEQSDVSQCSNWLEEASDYSGQILTQSIYVSRPVNWANKDYSGYALLNKYPIEELSQINFSNSSTKPDWRLSKLISCTTSNNNCWVTSTSKFACQNNDNPCGDGGAAGKGLCKNNWCVQSAGGGVNFVDLANTPNWRCRAYPEPDSPFPNLTGFSPALGPNDTGGLGQNSTGVHYCNETNKSTDDQEKAYACDCDYTKVIYGDIFTKYWKFSDPNSTEGSVKLDENDKQTGIPGGLCQGGPGIDGLACDNDKDCQESKTGNVGSTAGICLRKKQETQFQGWRGYCLEEDTSRIIDGDQSKHPCLTWLPVDSLFGASDIYNQHSEAGFNQDVNYCVKSNLFKRPGVLFGCMATGCYYDDDATISPDGDLGSAASYTKLGYGCGVTGIPINTYINEEKAKASCPTGYTYVRGEMDKGNCGDGDRRQRRHGSIPDVPGKVNFYCYPNRSFDENGAACQKSDGSPVGTPSDDTNRCYANFTVPQANGSFKNYGVAPDPDISKYDQQEQATHIKLDNSKYYVACEQFAQIEKDYSIAWTDRLWDKQPAGYYEVNFKNDGLSNSAPSLQTNIFDMDLVTKYKAATYLEPFGSAGPDIDKIDTALNVPDMFIIPWCEYRVAPVNVYAMPKVEFADCGTSATLNPNNPINTIYRSYNGWRFDKTDTTAVAVDEYKETADVGALRLRQLFAKFKTFRLWGNDLSSASFPNKGGANTGYGAPFEDPQDITMLATDITKAPVIMPLGKCYSNTSGQSQCEEGFKGGITVGNKSFGYSEVQGTQAFLKFFTYANENQMPIRQVTIDWGDSDPLYTYTGMYRNHRGTDALRCDLESSTCQKVISGAACNTNADCSVEGGAAVECNSDTKHCESASPETDSSGKSYACKTDLECQLNIPTAKCVGESSAPNFGQVLNRTCDNVYFQYQHPYICTKTSNEYTAVCPVSAKTHPNGCCLYTPRVQVRDNWGWYNGTCSGGSGCYTKPDANNLGLINEDESAWAVYKGQVVVNPLR